MLRPSYSELMEVLNEDRDLDSKITSRYTIVIATAKRARQIVNGAACDSSLVHTDKAVSIAISELERGLIKLYPEGLPDEIVALEIALSKQAASPDVLSDLDLMRDESDDLSAMDDFDDFEDNLEDDFDDFDDGFDDGLDDDPDEVIDEEI